MSGEGAASINVGAVLSSPEEWMNAALLGGFTAVSASYVLRAPLQNQNVMMIGVAAGVGLLVLDVLSPRISSYEGSLAAEFGFSKTS